MIENKFILSSNKILSLGIAVADTFAKPINKFPKCNTLNTFSGKGKKKTKRQLVDDYKKLFPQGT